MDILEQLFLYVISGSCFRLLLMGLLVIFIDQGPLKTPFRKVVTLYFNVGLTVSYKATCENSMTVKALLNLDFVL